MVTKNFFQFASVGDEPPYSVNERVDIERIYNLIMHSVHCGTRKDASVTLDRGTSLPYLY